MAMLAFALLAAASSPPPPLGCDRVPGIALLTDAAKTQRFIVMGERHGKVAAPRLFGDMVCHVARARPVNVFLEFPTDAGPALDAYLASDGSPEARDAFLAHDMWDPRYADGRNSAAMFALVETLRRRIREGAPIRVFATQPMRAMLRPQFYSELGRAADWAMLAAKHRDGVNLILVGTAHAALRDDADLGFPPAAARLRPEDVFAIGPREEGGIAWRMTPSDAGQPVMGPQALPGRAAPAGIAATADTAGGWNALYGFGMPAQSSPPRRATP